MNKQEIKDLKKHGLNPDNIVKPEGQIVSGLIVLSNGNKEIHDSGYPFIRIFGVIKDGLVDLGWHDHWIANVPTNTDSYGKNIFHIFSWENRDKKWKVDDNFFSCSTFQIGQYQEEGEFITLN